MTQIEIERTHVGAEKILIEKCAKEETLSFWEPPVIGLQW